MGGTLSKFVLWATSVRKQRLILGVLLLALARPTYVGYDFRGTSLLVIICIAGGTVGIGTAALYPHADHTDQRDTFLGITVALVFIVRFSVFIYDDLQRIDNIWSRSALAELYDGGSAPIIHLLIVYVGLVLAARPIRSRVERQEHDQ